MIGWTRLTFIGGTLVVAYLAALATQVLLLQGLLQGQPFGFLLVGVSIGLAVAILGLTSDGGLGLAAVIVGPVLAAGAGLLWVAATASSAILLIYGWPLLLSAACVGIITWSIAYARPVFWVQAIRGYAISLGLSGALLAGLLLLATVLRLADANGWHDAIIPAGIVIGILAGLLVAVGVRRRWDDIPLLGRLARGIVLRARSGLISIDGLPPVIKAVTVIGLLWILVTAGLVVSMLVTGEVQGPIMRFPGTLQALEKVPGRVAVLTYVVAVAGLAIAGATIAACAGVHPRAAVRRTMFAALAIVAISVGSTVSNLGNVVATLDDRTALVPVAWLPTISGVAATAGVGAGIVLLIYAIRARGPLPLAIVAAATPFMGALLLAAAFIGHEATLGLAVGDGKTPVHLLGVALGAAPVFAVVGMAGALVGIFFLWQSVAAARTVQREVGRGVSRRVARRQQVLFGLLGAKVIWWTAGVAGALPALVPGSAASAWDRVRSDGPVAWILAAGFAALVLVWLLRGARPSISNRGVPLASAFFVVGFEVAFLVSGALLIALPAITLLAPAVPSPEGTSILDCLSATTNPGSWTVCAIRWTRDLIPIAGTATWGLGLFVFAVAAWQRRAAIAVAFGAILLWTLPVPLRDLGIWLTGNEVVGPFRPSLMTIDAGLTVAVGVAAVVWWLGRQRRVTPGTLTLILVVSTLISIAGSIAPSGGRAIVVGLLLSFSIAFELIFGAQTENRPGPDRPARVTWSVGSRLLGLALLAIALAFDAFEQSVDLAELFIPPVVAVLVAAEVSRRARPSTVVQMIQARPAWRPIGWGIGGATLVGLLIAVGSMVPASPAPLSVASRYREFLDHVDVAQFTLQTRMAAVGATSTQSLDVFEQALRALNESVVSEQAWLAGQTPASCYEAEASRWAGLVASMSDFISVVFGEGDLGAATGRYLDANRALEAGTSPCLTST